MSFDAGSNVLPPAPTKLCFNKDEFIKVDYDIDKFLADARRHSSLEILREDLSVYMKILQSALVELINRDYADFVNLSSNLVGMDKIISNIKDPLNTFKGQVEELRGLLDDSMQKIQLKLAQRAAVREKKTTLQHLEGILTCIETMESILDMSRLSRSGEQATSLESHLVERISTEFNQLQFYVTKCKGLPLVDSVKPRINRITQVLQQNLEGMFTDGLMTSNEEMLTRCLRTYITIDKVSDAEALFRRVEVEPFMTEYISEAYMKQKGGSFAMYAKILEFQQQRCSLLLSVTRAKSGQEPLKGYDFMVNSVWPEVVDQLEHQAASVFAPGNPDKFYKEYLDGMEFLTSFELQCETLQSANRLRSHPAYQRFITKWSLPVYFQIRLQEIAGGVEKCYASPWSSCSDKSDYRLVLVSTTYSSIQACWKKGVYLYALTHRFWKLTLQILARLITFLTSINNGEVEIEYVVERAAMPRPSSRVDIIKSDGRGSPSSRSESPVVTTETRKPNSDELVLLIADGYKLMSQVSKTLTTEIIPAIGADEIQQSLLKVSLEESFNGIKGQLEVVEGLVSEEMVVSISGLMKQVSDIPRLYRRTNKEVPTKASGYIQQAIQLLEGFREKNKASLPEKVLQDIFTSAISSVIKQYEETTSDMLLSVKKMEDSLKRLKRGKTSTTMVGNMSDDDKIRTQIWLDVQEFTRQVERLGVAISSVPAHSKLLSEVEQALPNSQSKSAM
ncbi:conserved oligomeric Golgi complex subunit 2-like [Watersipora subatra]|uniref:conserved oligomeric Golgi complex subunit 2-like n=1 Tax=Watersipora subatra TaxID=2589382 RepID=UPI00355BE036